MYGRKPKPTNDLGPIRPGRPWGEGAGIGVRAVEDEEVRERLTLACEGPEARAVVVGEGAAGVHPRVATAVDGRDPLNLHEAGAIREDKPPRCSS